MSEQATNTKLILSAVASVAASSMLLKTFAHELIPNELKHYVTSSIDRLSRRFSSQVTIVIDEFESQTSNQVFDAANSYLGTVLNSSTRRFKVRKGEEEKNLIVTVDKNEEINDVYQGIPVTWELISTETNYVRQVSNSYAPPTPVKGEARSYELTFHKNHKEKVLKEYIPYIMERAKAIKEESKVIDIYSVDEYKGWSSSPISLDHPMSFSTLAMDSRMKESLIEDLDNFVNGKEYYRRTGRAWKRGYLLYGPPGTGKSSLIAAMANYLNYDIYDLDLTSVESNSDLRLLLLGMTNKGIVVFEDIDCTIKLENRSEDDDDDDGDRAKKGRESESKVTLSGLLNFVDGLASCCGGERVFVFTTNHKDRLDPALLRPGRMDMHIHMSYCSASAFRQLAHNYLGLAEHALFPEIEALLEEAQVTPAEVSGELMKVRDVQASLETLVRFLENKKRGEINIDAMAMKKESNVEGCKEEDSQQ